MSALVSFLSGSVFRMIWGEASSFITARQEHKYELARLELQAKLDDAQHARNMKAITVQAELGVKTIEVQRDAAIGQVEADAFRDAVSSVGRSTGIRFLDIWNGSIRPALATLAIVVVIAEVYVAGWVVSTDNRDLFFAILGIYIADRSLGKRGK